MKDEEFWDPDSILKDLLFETNLSIAEIAQELGETSPWVSKRIKQLGLDWVKRQNRKLSRGHGALLAIMQKLLPGETIITEHPLGERLRLDIYCDRYKLGAEYHGRQHFFFNDHHYYDKSDFEAAQARDERKLELCREQGIALVVFRFSDKLSEDAVYARMMDAIKSTPYPERGEKVSRFKGNHYYEAAKLRNKEYRKRKYQEYKQWKKT